MYGGITHISAVAVTSDLGKRGRHRIGGQYRRQGSLPGAWIRTSPHPSRWICDAPYPGRITDPIHVLTQKPRGLIGASLSRNLID